MVLVKIKPMGWVLVGLALMVAGVVGFLVSRSGPRTLAAVSTPSGFSRINTLDHISAADWAVAGALAADDLDAGEKMVGKPVTFVGTVTKVFVPEGNTVNILNFAENHRDAFSAVIEAKDYGKFADPKGVEGKRVLVSGQMILFKEQLEVKISSPDQLKIIDGAAPGAKATASPAASPTASPSPAPSTP